MRKVQFATGDYYHVYNRGVDKRKIFLGRQHYYRFILGLYEFNNQKATVNFNWRFNYQSPTSIVEKRRSLLVDIICFSLMPNHFHLILRQLTEGGISKFMQKLGTGYAKYFNRIYQRTGTLFEGRFKAILIEKDEYFVHLSRYIHLNCVGLIEPAWKEKGIKNWKSAKKFLNQYKWSSYLDYAGRHNFPLLVNKEFLLNYFGSEENYRKFTNSWVRNDTGLSKPDFDSW